MKRKISKINLNISLKGAFEMFLVTIYSNFILPSTNKFYVNDTPDIIYAPLISEHYGTNQWSPAQNKSVNVSLTYTRIIM